MTVRVSSEWSYRGLQALVLENERVRVVVLPELGGKIWQLTALRTPTRCSNQGRTSRQN